MLSETQKEVLRNRTVDVLLELRAAYLRTPGCNILKHYTQIEDRMRSAARTTATPEEWVTMLSRSLHLSAPSSSCSAAIRALADSVRELGCAREYMALVEDEYAYLSSVVRSLVDARKQAKEIHDV